MLSTESRYITRKTLLYETKVEYAKWCINHVKGCAHGCKYCYSYKDAKRYGQVQNRADWLNYQVVINALDILNKELPRKKEKIGQDYVHLCFTTDPFMYDSQSGRLFTDVKVLTMHIIELLNDYGVRAETLTKGYYPSHLVNLKGRKNNFGITLTSLNENFRQSWEKDSAPYQRKIDSLKFLSYQPNKTWVSIEPYPTPNILQQNLYQLLSSVDFVDRIIFGQMNYVSEATRYPRREEFYKNSVATVVNFCEDLGIEWHIKEKTPRPEGIDQSNFLNITKEAKSLV